MNYYLTFTGLIINFKRILTIAMFFGSANLVRDLTLPYNKKSYNKI